MIPIELNPIYGEMSFLICSSEPRSFMRRDEDSWWGAQDRCEIPGDYRILTYEPRQERFVFESSAPAPKKSSPSDWEPIYIHSADAYRRAARLLLSSKTQQKKIDAFALHLQMLVKSYGFILEHL